MKIWLETVVFVKTLFILYVLTVVSEVIELVVSDVSWFVSVVSIEVTTSAVYVEVEVEVES